MKTNGKMTFQAVVDFEIEPAQALHILSDPEPRKLLHAWFNERGCELNTTPSTYNVAELKKAHGQYLSDRAIEETKLLTVSTP